MEDAIVWRAVRPGESPEDAERHLVQRVALGDRLALDALIARYQRTLFQYLLQLTRDHQVAEEILQDTFVAVWQSATSFAGRSSVRTWLIGVARRQAHNTLRRAQLPIADEQELADVPATESEPEAQAIASAEREALAAAIGRLPAIHREVLLLTFVQNLSYQEIAQVVGVPIGTVRSRLSHAKAALRRELERLSAGE